MFRSKSPLRKSTARRNARSAWRGSAMTVALLGVADRRYRMFREKFGRDPELDEPLFFDPASDHPVQADQQEMRQQVVDAAEAARVSPHLVLKYFGLA